MKFFGPQERLWLIGPIALLMFWLYSLAVQAKGPWRWIIGPPFMVINCLFNAVFGSFIFAEPPREWFFTDRLKRQKASGDTDRATVAQMICSEMNKADPGHC